MGPTAPLGSGGFAPESPFHSKVGDFNTPVPLVFCHTGSTPFGKGILETCSILPRILGIALPTSYVFSFSSGISFILSVTLNDAAVIVEIGPYDSFSCPTIISVEASMPINSIFFFMGAFLFVLKFRN